VSVPPSSLINIFIAVLVAQSVAHVGTFVCTIKLDRITRDIITTSASALVGLRSKIRIELCKRSVHSAGVLHNLSPEISHRIGLLDLGKA
jgi:hypothetical protein